MRILLIFILKGLQNIARGRGATATTTPGWLVCSIGTLKGVRETEWLSPGSHDAQWRLQAARAIHGAFKAPLQLISPIPAGIKNRAEQMLNPFQGIAP
jgi:hypothetical protein